MATPYHLTTMQYKFKANLDDCDLIDQLHYSKITYQLWRKFLYLLLNSF